MTEEREPNKPLIREWVEALRSGKYKQGQHVLRNGDRFCCLGVACELYGKRYGIEWQCSRFFLGEGIVLPDEVVKELGLESNNPNLNYKGLNLKYKELQGDVTSAAGLNDSNVLFAEIADLIEEKYL